MSAAVVIGAHADALVAALALARAGRRVTVVEDHPTPAGARGWVPEELVRRLGLGRIAFEIEDPWLTIALADGGRLALWRDPRRTAEAIRAHSRRDAERWPAFVSRMARLARLMEGLYLAPPATPLEVSAAWKVRRLGREGMEDLMRLAPMPVAEWLDEWFESDALKGALGALGIQHLQQGPRSAGTGFAFLHQHAGSPPGVFRPPRSDVVEVLRAQPGLTLRSSRVERIEIRAGRVNSVVLAGGEEMPASLVVSGAGVRRTLLELSDPGWLDPELAREVSHVRARGVVAEVWFPGSSAFQGQLCWAPSLDFLERAYDDGKYRRLSAAPFVEARCRQDGVAVHYQYAPYQPAGGAWDDALRAEVARRAAACLAPVLGELDVAAAKVAAPPDLEAAYGWREGQAHDAELGLDQALWMRPHPDLARYRTPVEGLWLCGPGTHPGAGVQGASGWNCAQAILRG